MVVNRFIQKVTGILTVLSMLRGMVSVTTVMAQTGPTASLSEITGESNILTLSFDQAMKFNGGALEEAVVGTAEEKVEFLSLLLDDEELTSALDGANIDIALTSTSVTVTLNANALKPSVFLALDSPEMPYAGDGNGIYRRDADVKLSLFTNTSDTLVVNDLDAFKIKFWVPLVGGEPDYEADVLAVFQTQAQRDLEVTIENTEITGDLSNLVATFPATIPLSVIGAGYQINSRITLSEALPTGATVTITRDGDPYVTGATFTGTSMWITELLGAPLSDAADFDATYDGQVETYVITIDGIDADFATSIKIESIISTDVFASDLVVLAEKTLPYTLTFPTMTSVSPAEGAVVLAADETFVLTVDASDAGDDLYELEIDHNMSGSLPEFSVYADEANPYGDPDDLAQFQAAGVEVTYVAAEQKWTIDFGETITDAFLANGGITFYLVIKDLAGNTWGSMDPTTAENTFAYTLTQDADLPVLESVSPAEGSVYLADGDSFVLTMDAKDLSDNLYELEIDHSMSGSLPEFSVYADESNPYGDPDDLAQFQAAGVEVTYSAAEQKWTIDFGPTVSGAFLANGGITFYLVLHDTAGNTWGTMYGTTPDNTFAYTLIEPTADTIELTGAVSGNITINTPGLTILLKDGTVVTGGSPCFTVNASNTRIKTETIGGAVCLPAGGADGIVVADGLTNIIIEGLEIDGTDGGHGIFFAGAITDVILRDNFIHDAGGDGIFFTAQPGEIVAGANAIQGNYFLDNFGGGVNNPNGTDVDATYNAWGDIGGPTAGDGVGAKVSYTPWTHVDLYLESSGTAVADVVVLGEEITYTVYGNLAKMTGADFTFTYPAELDYITHVTPDIPFDFINFVTVDESSRTINVQGVSTTDLDGVVPLFEVTFKGLTTGTGLSLAFTDGQFTMNPGTGPSANIYPTALVGIDDLEVLDGLAVTYADLFYGMDPLVIDQPLDGNFDDGFSMFLDPTVDWFYLDTQVITSSNPLADGLYPFYLAGQTTPTFYVEVVGTTYTLIDGYLRDVEGITSPLRINGDFIPGTYTYVGDLTDIYGSSTTVSIEITFIDALAWLQANTVLSSVSGTIDDLKATFPASIPPVIVEQDYVIDSRMTLAEALPEGTLVTIYREGVAVPGLIDITLSGVGPFYFTQLFDPDADRAAFDAGYGGAVENYVIEVTGPGTNHLDFDTTVFIESVISKDGYVTETVLDDITLDVHIPADEDAALAWLQDNTVLSSVSGTIDDLKATFPLSIPPVIVDEDYVIDSRMTLAEALPAGTTVTVYKDGVAVLTDITLSGVGPFWLTELFDPDAPRADFDANYGGKVEDYVIVVTGPGTNHLDFDTTVFIESVISKDGYVTETVLDDITLGVNIPADEDAALAWLQANTVLSSVSGTIADLKATFPDSIPPVIVDEDYVIDSRITLTQPLPAGATVTVFKDGTEVLTDITLSGVGPFWFTELFDPDQPRAAFDANYGTKVEDYVIEVTLADGTTLAYNSAAFIESVISKDGYVTETVLDDITLAIRDLTVTDADLYYGTEPTVIDQALSGDFTDGFYMVLDPAEDWYYLDTQVITSNNPLADGMYPFYLAPDTTTPIFYVKVEETTYTLIDAYQGDPNPLRINGDFALGTYTYAGELTDIYGTSAPVSIEITFVGAYDVKATVRMQGRTVSSGVDMILTAVDAPVFGPFTEISVDLISLNLAFGKLEGVTYEVTTDQDRYLDVLDSLNIQFLLNADKELAALVLKAGDADNDDVKIDLSDAAIVGAQYGIGDISSDGDVNYDDRVNIQDLALVGGNYLLTPLTAYGSWTP